MKYIILIWLIILGFNSVLFSQIHSKHQSVTRAVVIGISDYQDSKIPDLSYAHKDAEAFAAWLHSKTGGNLTSDNIKLLLNENATLGKVSTSISWLLDKSHSGDKAIIYFSGHGDMEAKILNQLGFLLLWDSPAKAYIAGALPVDVLKQVVTTLSVEHKTNVLLITDACRSGKLAGNNIIGTQLTNTNLLKQFSNEQKILSCQADEYSIEGVQWGGGSGVFTWHLIKGLSGEADKNSDKSITLLEIEHFLQDHVSPEVEPISQIPLAIGNKNKIIVKVNKEMLDSLMTKAEEPEFSFSKVEQRGIVKDIMEQADTSIIELYRAFQNALDKKQLLEPKEACAETYYQKLIQIDSIEALHDFLRRNLAATFLEDAQQAINAYLDSDPDELNRISRWDDNYRLYPFYLKKAAELLGPDNHFYSSIVARQKYFEALYLRLFFDVVHSDTLFNRAVKILEESLSLEPKAPYVYYELGLLYDRRLEKEIAVEYLLKVIEISPTWLIPYIELIQINGYLDRHEDTYHLFKNAFAILEPIAGEFKEDVYAGWGKSAWHIGKIEESEAVLTKAIAEIPDVKHIPYFLAHLYRSQGRFEEALAILEKAKALNPDNGASYWELARTKFMMGEIDEFITLNEKGLSMSPYRAYDYVVFAQNLMDCGRIQKALDVIERLFQLDPAYRYNNRVPVQIFHNLNRPHEAEQLLNIKKGLNPDKTSKMPTDLGNGFPYQANYSRLMGLHYRHYKWYDDAIEMFLKSLQLDPHNAEAKIYLADLYLSKGFIKQAAAILPENFVSDGLAVNLVAGRVYYKLKKPNQALIHFKEFVKLSNEYRYPNNTVGAFYRKHGAFDSAKSFLEEDIRLRPEDKTFPPSDCRCETNLLKKDIRFHPTNLTSRINLALVYFFSNNFMQCFDLLSESIKKEPGQLSLRALKALLHYINNPIEAEVYFNEANALAPGFSELWSELELMRKDRFDLADNAWKEAQSRFDDWWMDIIKYNYMLMKIREHDMEEALDILYDLLEKGIFVNYQYFITDEKLAPIRNIPQFKELMRKFFPEKY